MSVLAYDITQSSVTFITDDGLPRSAHQSHPHYTTIRDQLLSGTADADELILLVDTKRAIEGKTFGLVTVGDDAVWYQEQQIQGYLVEKLLAMLSDGVDIEPWAMLLNKLMLNPNQRARERLPLFLTENGLPITRDGYFLGWRLVKDDYWDIHTGITFENKPGAVLQMDRLRCDSDPDQTCSSGIHVAAFSYLDNYGFGHEGKRCMLVKVNPADVVAIPTDYGNAKLRTCKIEVLREVAKDLVPALFGRNEHVTSEHGYVEDEFDDEFYEDEEEVNAGPIAEAMDVLTPQPAVEDNIKAAVMRIDRKTKTPTSGRKYYVAGEAGAWIVVRRSTGHIQRTFTSRDAARAHVHKLNA